MPKLGGLDPRYWTIKAFLADLTIPSIVVLTIAFIIKYAIHI